MEKASKDAAIIVIDNDGLVVSWSASAERMLGWSSCDVVGKPISMLQPPGLSEIGRRGRDPGIESGNGVLSVQTERVRKNGSRFVAEVVIKPLLGGDGRSNGYAELVCEVDMRSPSLAADIVKDTPLTSPEELPATAELTQNAKVDESVRVSEIRYRRLFEAAKDGVLLLDPNTRKITDANPYILSLLDYTLDELMGKELFEIGLLRDEAASREMFDRLRRNDQVRYEDLPLESRTGRHQEVEVVANVYDEDGHSVIQCNIRDITERKKAEQHNKMLMAEVNHRSKNLLAVVQAIAKQTARRGDPATFIDRLCDRMDGLAASQDLLVRNEWRGVRVMDLVKAQVAHFQDLVGTRILIDGPPVQLSPVAAQGIGMALHELATNAAKYGSLSNLEGRVLVSWHISSGTTSRGRPILTLQWREEGGPKVHPPEHQGFGQLVIGRMAEAAVDGRADIDYPESGLCWTLTGSVMGSLKGDRASSPEHHVT